MVTTPSEAYPEEVEVEPSMPLGEQPLHEYLRHWANHAPNQTVLNYHGQDLTYKELNNAVDSFAATLQERGYGSDDTLLLFLQNCPQFYIGYYAAHRLGMRVSPCSPMAKEHRTAYQLNDGNVRVVLALDAYADVLKSVRDETPVEDIFYTRFETYLPKEPIPSLHEDVQATIEVDRQVTDKGTHYLSEVLNEEHDPPETAEYEMDDVVLLQYTSGTTGMPKGCKHTHRTILNKAASNAAVMGVDESTRLLEVMPVFHVAGKLFAVDTPMIYGSSVVLLTRYSPTEVLEAVDDHEPTTGWLTTPMVRGLLGHEKRSEYDLSSFEHNPATSFGQALTDDLCQRWKEATGADMYEAAYGLSESHTMDTFTRGLNIVEEGFVGRPVHDVDIVVRDWDTHEEVPRGEMGEISVSSPSVMEGYWNKPEKTAAAMYNDYILTGDIGRMTDDDCLYFLGRRKNMIKSSGHSVSPAEVEQILKIHDDVENAVVVGKEHESRGEIVVAFVTTDNDELTEDDVIEWSGDQMAEYKCPKGVNILDSLPTTDVGKLDRQQIKEMV